MKAGSGDQLGKSHGAILCNMHGLEQKLEPTELQLMPGHWSRVMDEAGGSALRNKVSIMISSHRAALSIAESIQALSQV